MTKPHIHYIHPCQMPIHIGFTTSELAFGREMKRLGVKDAPRFVSCGANGATHILENHGIRTVIVCVKLKRGATHTEMTGLIVHEAMHCWQECLKAMGEDEPSCELEAYTVQHIVQSFLYELTALRRKK